MPRPAERQVDLRGAKLRDDCCALYQPLVQHGTDFRPGGRRRLSLSGEGLHDSLHDYSLGEDLPAAWSEGTGDSNRLGWGANGGPCYPARYARKPSKAVTSVTISCASNRYARGGTREPQSKRARDRLASQCHGGPDDKLCLVIIWDRTRPRWVETGRGATLSQSCRPMAPCPSTPGYPSAKVEIWPRCLTRKDADSKSFGWSPRAYT